MPMRPHILLAALVGLPALASARPAHANGGDAFLFSAFGLFAPSDVGVAASDPANPRLAIGWSWQIPFPLFMTTPLRSELVHHRIVPAIDLLPQAGGASWRGRLGYRYDRSHAFVGAGVGADGAGVNLSPEVGVKFLQAAYEPDYCVEISLHLLARAEIAPESGHLRGVTFMLGWNLF
jgi:hypothetical protein